MSLENALVSGYSPEREPEAEDIEEQEPEKVYICPRCNSDFTGDTRVYDWEGEYICVDCLQDAINSMEASDIADMMLINISTAEDEA